MGANILGNVLGHLGADERAHNLRIDGACVIQAPIRMWIGCKPLFESMGGFYNRRFGANIKALMLRHAEALNPACLEKLNKTVPQLFEQWTERQTTVMAIDEAITSKLYGFGNREDYYYKASCFHRIPTIRTPTIFINAMDDPIVSPNCIDYDVFRNSRYVALATTRYGGHLGYMESVRSQEMWIIKPCIEFFKALDSEK